MYAILMLVVVVFFLIYGVEVYFKIRGAFIQGESCPANVSQLHQSRLGLISQAVLLLVTVMFIISDVLGSFWKNKSVLALFAACVMCNHKYNVCRCSHPQSPGS